MSTESAAGWAIFPFYDGPQAGSLSSPASQGTSAAADASTIAASLGIPAGSVIYDDMESFASSYDTAVMEYESAWTNGLHQRGYLSGFYSSASTGITDLVDHTSGGYQLPDVIDNGEWNGSVTTSSSYIPSLDWNRHQRIHQYAGGHNETYGGDTISIDSDYLDVSPPVGTTSVAVASGKCLDEDVNTVKDISTIAQTWTCTAYDANQEFSFYPQPNGTVIVKSAYSGKCLDEDANTIHSTSTKVQFYTCLANDVNQQWYFHLQAGTGYYTVTSAASGKCLDEDANTVSNPGTKVQTWACQSGDSNQIWHWIF
jgi:hypothetical protein